MIGAHQMGECWMPGADHTPPPGVSCPANHGDEEEHEHEEADHDEEDEHGHDEEDEHGHDDEDEHGHDDEDEHGDEHDHDEEADQHEEDEHEHEEADEHEHDEECSETSTLAQAASAGDMTIYVDALPCGLGVGDEITVGSEELTVSGFGADDDHDDHDEHDHGGRRLQASGVPIAFTPALSGNYPAGTAISHTAKTRTKRWGAAIGASFVVMSCTLIGVIFIAPFFAKLQKKHEAIVTTLANAFAAGALLAAAFYLMLYEATHLIAITDSRPESDAAAWWGSAVLVGFVTPFLLETIVVILFGSIKKPGKEEEENKEADPEAVSVAIGDPTRAVRVLSAILMGDFLHNLVDGLFIGAAFSGCDTAMGWTITAATVYHELAQEISDYLVLTNPAQCGLKPFMALGLNFVSGFSVLFGVCIMLSAEPGNFSTGMMLAYGAGVYLEIACTDCMSRVHEFATTIPLRLAAFLLFCIGAVAIGLVLLDHEHCSAGGGHDGHNHP